MKHSRIDIMVDLETIGLGDQYPVIQIGAIAFDLSSGSPVAAPFNERVYLFSDVLVSADTLRWWVKDEGRRNTFAKILCERADRSESSAFEAFDEWIHELAVDHCTSGLNGLHLWSNGIAFDSKILKTKFEQFGLTWPIHYRNDRDMRTLLDPYLALTGQTYEEVKIKANNAVHQEEHEALSDCQAQIWLVSQAWRTLTHIPGSCQTL